MASSVRDMSLKNKDLRISIPVMVAPPDESSTCCAGTAQPCAEKTYLGEEDA